MKKCCTRLWWFQCIELLDYFTCYLYFVLYVIRKSDIFYERKPVCSEWKVPKAPHLYQSFELLDRTGCWMIVVHCSSQKFSTFQSFYHYILGFTLFCDFVSVLIWSNKQPNLFVIAWAFQILLMFLKLSTSVTSTWKYFDILFGAQYMATANVLDVCCENVKFGEGLKRGMAYGCHSLTKICN